MKKTDTLLFVIDVKTVRTPLARATGAPVAPVAGLPTVRLAADGKPTITVPAGAAAPTQLVTQVLIKGTGPAVTAGQTITVHYTGVKWDGKQFDSSWDRGQPLDTAIGNGSVIAGWDEGLVGQTVGSQVLLVVPPDKGYGTPGSSDGKSRAPTRWCSSSTSSTRTDHTRLSTRPASARWYVTITATGPHGRGATKRVSAMSASDPRKSTAPRNGPGVADRDARPSPSHR